MFENQCQLCQNDDLKIEVDKNIEAELEQLLKRSVRISNSFLSEQPDAVQGQPQGQITEVNFPLPDL